MRPAERLLPRCSGGDEGSGGSRHVDGLGGDSVGLLLKGVKGVDGRGGRRCKSGCGGGGRAEGVARFGTRMCRAETGEARFQGV